MIHRQNVQMWTKKKYFIHWINGVLRPSEEFFNDIETSPASIGEDADIWHSQWAQGVRRVP